MSMGGGGRFILLPSIYWLKQLKANTDIKLQRWLKSLLTIKSFSKSLSYQMHLNVVFLFSWGGGLTFYWCISFARYAIYWYKRLEVKDCFGRKNTKGSDGMEGCFFASIRKGIGPSWQYNHWISLDFIGFFRGGALFSARNIFWKGFRDQISIPSRWKKDGENVSLWTLERAWGKMVASEMF